MKKQLSSLILSLSATITYANIPADNIYRVQERQFSAKTQPQQFSIAAREKAPLIKLKVDSYTQRNPLRPDDVYTIKPYTHLQGFPMIGKWMLIPNGIPQVSNAHHAAGKPVKPPIEDFVVAHWISLMNGKDQYIIEPINYIFIVFATEPNSALTRFNEVTTKIHFDGTATENHTNGYHAFIGDGFYEQLKNTAGLFLTYSNGDFRFQNDHFRVFGAYPMKIDQQQAFILVASVSEESGMKSEWVDYSPATIKLLAKKGNDESRKHGYYTNYGHRFVSFANARNSLATALIKAGYPTYYAALGNVVNTASESTEDHDGNVYITVIR